MAKAGGTTQSQNVTAQASPGVSKALAASVVGDPLPLASPQEVKKEANPFTDSDWRMWLYAWSGFFLRIMLVFGTLFSIYQYSIGRQEKRIERTMQLVELWESADNQEAQKALSQRLTELNDKYQAQIGGNLNDQQMSVLMRKIGDDLLTAEGGSMPLPEFQAKFDAIVYFLNRVGSCATANICERGVVNDYFEDFARSFWSYFAGYVQRQRQAGSSNYAQPLEAYLLEEDAADTSVLPRWLTDLINFWL